METLRALLLFDSFRERVFVRAKNNVQYYFVSSISYIEVGVYNIYSITIPFIYHIFSGRLFLVSPFFLFFCAISTLYSSEHENSIPWLLVWRQNAHSFRKLPIACRGHTKQASFHLLFVLSVSSHYGSLWNSSIPPSEISPFVHVQAIYALSIH